MTKAFLVCGTSLAALSVILCAFGAHALKDKLQPEQIQIFETGVRYQMYHSLALIFLFLASLTGSNQNLHSPSASAT